MGGLIRPAFSLKSALGACAMMTVTLPVRSFTA